MSVYKQCIEKSCTNSFPPYASISIGYTPRSEIVRSKGNAFTILIAIAKLISQFSMQETETILDNLKQEGTCYKEFGAYKVIGRAGGVGSRNLG